MRELRSLKITSNKCLFGFEFVLLFSAHFPNWESITAPLALVSSEVCTRIG